MKNYEFYKSQKFLKFGNLTFYSLQNVDMKLQQKKKKKKQIFFQNPRGSPKSKKSKFLSSFLEFPPPRHSRKSTFYCKQTTKTRWTTKRPGPRTVKANHPLETHLEGSGEEKKRKRERETVVSPEEHGRLKHNRAAAVAGFKSWTPIDSGVIVGSPTSSFSGGPAFLRWATLSQTPSRPWLHTRRLARRNV